MSERPISDHNEDDDLDNFDESTLNYDSFLKTLESLDMPEPAGKDFRFSSIIVNAEGGSPLETNPLIDLEGAVEETFAELNMLGAEIPPSVISAVLEGTITRQQASTLCDLLVSSHFIKGKNLQQLRSFRSYLATLTLLVKDLYADYFNEQAKREALGLLVIDLVMAKQVLQYQRGIDWKDDEVESVATDEYLKEVLEKWYQSLKKVLEGEPPEKLRLVREYYDLILVFIDEISPNFVVDPGQLQDVAKLIKTTCTVQSKGRAFAIRVDENMMESLKQKLRALAYVSRKNSS